ncbi:hypothetical protein GOP47_0024192 [Adiantum capillus-veneris]|uniref:Glycosyltransferase n=1 Tax=Adiantum capillus-veneris TaxID=13818 RepID=A0A9D4U467_ADICA|nr:hypothetical protein GOP47_0023703 [Adiantum capillus-veneris]KAI5061687.1 hypothetical protein GOP47_0024192 [Adiantum capillus-veneris]
MAAHAVLVSGPGLGHINGCMPLAKSLLSTPSFSHITIVCFARSYHTHLTKGHLSNLSHPSVRLEIVPDELPLDTTTSYSQLFATTPAMHDNLVLLLKRFHEEHRPATCLISDMIMAWTQSVADEMGIPRVEYWTASATSYLCLVSIPHLMSKGFVCSHKGPEPLGWKTEKKIELDCIPGLPRFPLEEVPRELRYAESTKGPVVEKFVIAAHNAHRATCVLIHSAFHLEPHAFHGLSHIGITPYPIGPLLHQSLDATSPLDPTILTWLDSHATSSVIYVSFGSNSKLSEQELVELALGLEASRHPFLLVVREDATIEGRHLKELLPLDYFSRIDQQGLIVPWAPQCALLAHHAIGGFLSHCGWNSTMESLWMGVPILACPRAAEQPINCRLIVEDWGVGIELQTTQEGTFSKHDVNVGVTTLLVGEAGHLARRKAKEFSKKLREAPMEGGHSHSSLLNFASNILK